MFQTPHFLDNFNRGLVQSFRPRASKSSTVGLLVPHDIGTVNTASKTWSNSALQVVLL